MSGSRTEFIDLLGNLVPADWERFLLEVPGAAKRISRGAAQQKQVGELIELQRDLSNTEGTGWGSCDHSNHVDMTSGIAKALRAALGGDK